MNLLQKQIELEKRMTQGSIDKYRKEFELSKQNKTFGCTSVATKLMSFILDDFVKEIKNYLTDYSKGKAIKSTLAAQVINRLNDIDAVAYLTAKTILNAIWSKIPTTAMYKQIGQNIEDEYKMREFKAENSHYYTSIQTDLNKRGAKANRKKNITTGVFNKRLDFHLDRWTITEKFQTGLVLTNIFVKATGLVEFVLTYRKNKSYKYLIPKEELVQWIENLNDKLELMQPLFLPMVVPPKEWTSILDGGYISPYLKRNKLIKNNDRTYLKQLETAKMPVVYEAINHLQNTAWQVNKRVLDVVNALWEEGKAVAELPDREDEPLIAYPYPDKTKDDAYTDEEKEIIKKWKRDTYDIHKRNVQKRSVRLLCSQILRIANQFKEYDEIFFPHQMDFRGRLYPIPVLLQPQGTDLAKGLLHFARGKPIEDNKALRWLMIQGANVYGYDKVSYDERIDWVKEHTSEIRRYANDPLTNRGWVDADKPFQFLAWCFEWNDFYSNPDEFISHLPIQLDGTCNGLQHYSALLRDRQAGRAVNLINSDKPNDIYGVVATRLEEKLNELLQNGTLDADYSRSWLNLGINRKLTKRPVMVLPYGGTRLSCREYIQEYLNDTYSPNFVWKHFGIGESPSDCIFKVSVWLSEYLWQSIQETLKAATVGMDYLRRIARILTKEKQAIQWFTPAGLLIKQAYASRKKKEIKTELYGSILKTTINLDLDTLDTQRQLNGICPNFIHSLDAACLMLYLIKCKQSGIDSFMTVHDCYGTLAADTEQSAKLLREAFVEIYKQPILDNFVTDVLSDVDINKYTLPERPEDGDLDVEEVLKSEYFFN